MNCIDAIWLATETMDMRAGSETASARVITVFGAAKPRKQTRRERFSANQQVAPWERADGAD